MSWWSPFSRDNIHKWQQDLIGFSEVAVREEWLKIGRATQIYCLKCGVEGKPVLVMLHGYCAAGIFFFKLLKALEQDYFVILLDLLGMGRSSRPKVTWNSEQEAEAFFVEAIEQARLTLGLNTFSILGHSFGGFLAGCYSLKYPHNVEKILFVSAVGIGPKPANYCYFNTLERKPWQFRWLGKLVCYCWCKNFSPIDFLRVIGPLSPKLIKIFSNKRFRGLGSQERKAITEYLSQIIVLPASGELALLTIMELGAWAKLPLCTRLANLNIPMAFFFGDRDWVSDIGVDTIRQTNHSLVLTYKIADAGHYIFFDNPIGLSAALLDALTSLNSSL